MTSHPIKAPFTWYGSKARHLKFILPNIPYTKHYCEPFGGSGSVMLARAPAPIETYNDIDSELVNFFKVLREDPEELQKMATLTPYSREEYKSFGATENINDIERARRFFFRACNAYSGRPRGGSFAVSKGEIKRGISDRVSRYFSNCDNLTVIANRLLTVQIENMDAIDLIKKYDSPDTLFYCDPPYSMKSRVARDCYRFELDEIYHRLLSQTLNRIVGRAIVSGYASKFYDELYSGWLCVKGPINKTSEFKSERQEVLWMNYDPASGSRIKTAPTIKQTSISEIAAAIE